MDCAPREMFPSQIIYTLLPYSGLCRHTERKDVAARNNKV